MSASAAFGGWAADWLARIPDQRDLIVADPLGARDALTEAVARKRAGVPFYASVLLRTPRGALAFALSAELLAQSPDYDQRCSVFDHLATGRMLIGGRPQHEVSPLDPMAAGGLRALVELADGIVVRSRTEYRALRALLGFRAVPVRVITPPDPHVPPFRGARPSLVLVWAPQWSVEQIGVFTLAMQEVHLPMYAVCASGVLDRQRGVVVAARDAGALLSEAALVIDTSMTDPGTALAFARSNVPLAVASTTGATEFLANIAVYDPWERRSVIAAVLEGLGRGPAQIAIAPQAGPIALGASPDRTPPDSGPVLSLIVRTHGEHPTLERTLRSIDEQTYANIETIVVNDGGAPLGSFSARHRIAKVVNHAVNAGACAAANSGLAAANGAYCCLLDDDDALFPDWGARVAHALARSHAQLAHIDAVTVVAERRPGGRNLACGYVVAIVPGVGPSDLLVKNAFWGALRVIFTRERALASGGFTECCGVEDYDMWLRLSRDADFVHVAGPAAFYTLWNDHSNLSFQYGSVYAREHGRIHDRYPVVDRPLIEQGRAEKLEFLRANNGWPLPRVPLPIDPPIPLL